MENVARIAAAEAEQQKHVTHGVALTERRNVVAIEVRVSLAQQVGGVVRVQESQARLARDPCEIRSPAGQESL